MYVRRKHGMKSSHHSRHHYHYTNQFYCPSRQYTQQVCIMILTISVGKTCGKPYVSRFRVYVKFPEPHLLVRVFSLSPLEACEDCSLSYCRQHIYFCIQRSHHCATRIYRSSDLQPQAISYCAGLYRESKNFYNSP